MRTPPLTIGELAARTGCTPEAIRYYEREGVVPRPLRSGSGRYRHYEQTDVERFSFLRRARDLGFSLTEVRELVSLADGDPRNSCADVSAIARAHLVQVEIKLSQLVRLRDELSKVIDECGDGMAVADCRILDALKECPRCQSKES